MNNRQIFIFVISEIIIVKIPQRKVIIYRS